jgi:hypothetical protein
VLGVRTRSCPEACTKVAILSTESIASSSLKVGATGSCAGCGAPLAADQRYCLECGERCTPVSSVLLGGPPRDGSEPAAGTPPAQGDRAADARDPRTNTVIVLAGVGVLLLAMGVGVLIGRSGASKAPAPSAQVIKVSSTPETAAGAGAAAAASLTDDWPANTSGYTVQLQALPQSSTQVSTVEADKAAATAKGATGVGALKSEDFSSLTAGSYVIYAGVYHKKTEAEKALAGLTKNFPGATVIRVSNVAASSSSSNSGASSGGSGVGSSESHPAPPSVLKNLRQGGGQSYEQKSKNLPDVVETG